MTVSVQHLRDGDLDVAVVSGLGGDGALSHLCASLREGVAFAGARLMVVDLSDMASVSADSLDALRRTAKELASRRKCLAIVDAHHRQLPAVSAPGASYADVPTAVRAARRYFRFVAGGRAGNAVLADAADVVFTAAQISVRTVPRVIRRLVDVVIPERLRRWE